jgi:hypothetical protein
MRQYSATEIIGIGIFICFCTGILSVQLGIVITLASMFLLNTALQVIGVTMIFFGLALSIGAGGAGCFIPEEDRVLVR